MIAPVGVILAGGRATRMGGGDKGRLMLDNHTSIIDSAIARLLPQVSDLAISANGDPARFADLRLTVLPDSIESNPGPLAGVLAGMDWAAHMGASHIATVAADTPFFPCDLVPQLQLMLDQAPIALAATRDGDRIYRHPTFGLWPVSLRDDLRAALHDGVRKVVIWTDRHGSAQTLFATDAGDPFFNVNTPEDLTRAKAMIA